MGRGPGMGMGMNQGRLLADEALAAVLVKSELNLVSRGKGFCIPPGNPEISPWFCDVL